MRNASCPIHIMDGRSCNIQPLPLEVQGQIRSSVTITVLNDVVLELLKNALDAGANSIDIQVDLSKGYCSVSDNGIGIPAQGFVEDGYLGKLHCKCAQSPIFTLTDLVRHF